MQNFESIQITEILAREILDSRGFPTVEVELKGIAGDGSNSKPLWARAAVPSGASTGEGEAMELRDGDPKRFLGKGVLLAVQNVSEKIAPALKNKKFATQADLDRVLCALDGTPYKTKLGANAILGVSMAYTRLCAEAQSCAVSQVIAAQINTSGHVLPVPLMNILNGGKHADNGLAIQEFMIVPIGFSKFSESLRAGVEVFHHLKKILHSMGHSTAVGDEGGFAPSFKGDHPHEAAIEVILKAIQHAGYKAGSDIYLALDCAASEFRDSAGNYQFEGKSRSSGDLVALYRRWVENYPIVSIEDGLAENDWQGWTQLTSEVGSRCQIVGDDLFVTNVSYLKQGIDKKAANSILIKLNQIGTVTETLDTMRMAKEAGFTAIVSHRSGETEDTFIAELAVGTDCGEIKTGSASRTDRVAKYNQLLRIEERLASHSHFAGQTPFRKWLKT